MAARAWAALLALLLGLGAGAALASPTANEYRECHRRAAARLQFCLDQQPGGQADAGCWTQSRQQQQACYRELRASHARPPPRQPEPPRR